MNEGLTGWGEPPAEETEAPAAETIETETTETETEQPTEETPEESLILGRFRTPEDLETGYRELEREKGRLADELGKLRQHFEQPETTAPQSQYRNVEEAVADLTARSVDELASGDYDDLLSQITGRDVSRWGPYDYMRWQMRAEQAMESRQVQQRQFAQQIETTWTTYVSQNPDLADNPFVAEVDNELSQSGHPFQTLDEYCAAVGAEARKRAQAFAAKVMGSMGGRAAAERKAAGVVPGGGIPGGGAPVQQGPDPQRYRVGWGNPDA